MKALIIGMDRKLFEKDSDVRKRMLAYASRMEELHVVVFSLTIHKLKNEQEGNLYLYPTNSFSRFLHMRNGYILGKKIITTCKLSKDNTVISTQDPSETGIVGKKLKRKFGFPLQVQIHTDFLSPHFKGFLNSIRKHLARKVLKAADRVRVVSSVMEGSLLKKFPDLAGKIDILPVFVDIEKIVNTVPTRDIKKEFPQWKFHVFMASRLTKEKRFDTALKAFARVVKEYPQAGLIIAGSGPEKVQIEEMAKKLGLEKNISFLGWQNDLVSYYKTCNVFLLTSEYEGYGMTLIEAGASGTMIVTTKVGIAKTNLFIDEENSHVCPVGDFECIANCIIQIIRDNPKRELFARKIQEGVRAQSISPQNYYATYVSLLEKLLKK